MATMNLELGPPEVFPELPKTFAARPPDSPPITRVAILVVHGMGQQVPYETIDGVRRAAIRGAITGGGTVNNVAIRSVRLGNRGKDGMESELVRAEIQIKPSSGQEHEVHIYEAYWAPITEGKVTAADVVKFLSDAGWNGIKDTIGGLARVGPKGERGEYMYRFYQRWIFGAYQQFSLPTERLALAFLGVMALLGALVFINSVVTAAAASHAIGSTQPFPSGVLLPLLTWDFVLVDVSAVLIIVGIFILGRLKPKLIPWLFIYGGASLIVAAAILMAGHLTQGSYFLRFVPGDRWTCFVSKRSATVFLLWAGEIWVASKVRNFLIQYVGDVAAYVAPYKVSKFWDLRRQIWQTAMSVGEAVYRARTDDGAEFLYTKITVVGHSLGSVIGYDVLNGLLLDEQFSSQPLHVAARTRMFLTFGSPLDKTAFVFRTQKDMLSQVLGAGAAAVQPMITSYVNRPQEWVNLWSHADIISGHLDFYDPPNVLNAKHPEHYVHSRLNPKGVQNYIDPDAKTPLKAHIEYWDGRMFAEQLYRGITT